MGILGQELEKHYQLEVTQGFNVQYDDAVESLNRSITVKRKLEDDDTEAKKRELSLDNENTSQAVEDIKQGLYAQYDDAMGILGKELDSLLGMPFADGGAALGGNL